ncbi:hypothetical protein SCANM63S_00040 [Streptomyces canarius]
MDPLGIWNGCTTKALRTSRNVRQRKSVRVILPPGSHSVTRDTNAKRDRPSTPGVPGWEERSRSVGCASVSIGARCYPAPL